MITEQLGKKKKTSQERYHDTPLNVFLWVCIFYLRAIALVLNTRARLARERGIIVVLRNSFLSLLIWHAEKREVDFNEPRHTNSENRMMESR